MLQRKLEAIERRLTKLMSKDPASREKLMPAFDAIHGAYLAASEDRLAEAERLVNEFNRLIKEIKRATNS